MGWFKNLFRSSSSIIEDSRAYGKCGKSWLFDDFPLNPQPLIRGEGPLKDQSLLDISEIGRCICVQFQAWKLIAEKNEGMWPEYASKELTGMIDAYERMKSNVPSKFKHKVDSEKIMELAWMYIERIMNDEKAYASFLKADDTLMNLTIDFGNTISCGGKLQTALKWYEWYRGNYKK